MTRRCSPSRVSSKRRCRGRGGRLPWPGRRKRSARGTAIVPLVHAASVLRSGTRSAKESKGSRSSCLDFPKRRERPPLAFTRTKERFCCVIAQTRRSARCALTEDTMNRLGWLTGCALALACAHEGKSVTGESETKMPNAAATEGVKPQAPSTADASKQKEVVA